MTEIQQNSILRRYPRLLAALSITFLVLMAIGHAGFLRVARTQRFFPTGLFLTYVFVSVLLVLVAFLVVKALLASQRLSAIKAQEQLRNQLLQMAAHELRNPMASIKAMLALLRRRIHNSSPPEVTLALTDTVENEVDRLASILTNLLEAFEANHDRMQLQLAPVDLRDCVKMALKPFLASESQREFHVDVESQADPLLVVGDALRIDEVLRNLLNNAVKYSPADRPIQVRVYADEDQAIVAISDFGIGIPKRYQERVFESFFRGDNFGDEDPGGMGLGLFICREIIHRHRGSIQLESTPGQGSTFYVRLPRYTASSDAPSFDELERVGYLPAS